MRPYTIARLRRHFGVMAALSVGPLVATSFARFAYALVLPAMRSELDLTYSQAGSLNTANGLGYLVGSLIAMRYASRWGNRRLFVAGMIVTVLALFGTGITDSFYALLCLRAIAGVSGALVFISGVVLASSLFPDRPALSAAAIATYFGGAGVGIVVSGVAIPWILATMGHHAWRDAWLAIAGASAVLAVFSIRASARVNDPVTTRANVAWPARELSAALTSYFLFGLGYIGYMTFVVASMKSKGASHVDVALTWGTLGMAATLAPLVWRVPRSRWDASKMLPFIGLVITVGAAIPLYSVSRPAMIMSALLFGVAMFSIPASITDLVKVSLPKAAWGSAMAFFTVMFAIGQIIGPLFTGWLADATHALNAGLAGSTVILLAASLIAMYQRQVVIRSSRRRDPRATTAV